jgi:hypothetical protein
MGHKVIIWFAVADLVSLVALVAWWVVKGEIPEWKPKNKSKSDKDQL